jgi:hypothetical protein
MLRSSSAALLAAASAPLSGAASYGLSAWIASANGDGCNLRYLPGTNISAAFAFLALIFVPAAAVGYRAVVTRKSRITTIGLTVATAILTLVAVLIVGLIWAVGHDCFE